MKSSEKKMILVIVLIGVVIIGGLLLWKGKANKEIGDNKGDKGQTNEIAQGEYTKVEEGGKVVNTSEKINTTKEMEGFTLTNVSLKEENGETLLSARVTNSSNKEKEAFLGNVVLLDKGNNEIGRIPVRVSETKAGEAVDIEASITESYVNAYDFRLEK